ncbi:MULTISPECIES: TonB-dependent receptor [unclassified Mucilaginibacter]|uniref:TonB-dependent receptor n=1 Tax=unclassified Mucilaginibacter TaxID=2617802 RepID=UPI002AC984C4|nr:MULTISPECIES: TonB-dependent receptor [unclassified Mucilaginibacter]MEB0263871.1 TonB-dependent receptor [Mucilaginibacter sp. 10I4]MEB0279110.1 TonB-dependent receptor [Mucilaginibacter sp. 10B2]MEB0302107.1 TonB-dependent receptor [Mucilaginibacter sp. 5C4]WPX22288.1 carboxypeptidase regulatory-like domain-containing protein [Mucilaginibacter sp. 5C4]
MRKYLLLLFFSLVTAAATFAQVTTSSLSGTVVDEKGLPLPGVTIIALHGPTGTNYTTGTRADGRYNLPNLRVGGPYTVTFKFIGFNNNVQSDVSLSLGQEFKINAKLSPTSTLLNEVQITGTQNKVINNSRTGSQEIITRSQIDRLPTINRSISDYTKLTPTANGNSFGGRSEKGNNLTVDGALFNNSFGLSSSLGGQTGSQPISLDAIEQIQVSVSPFDVTQGRFAGTGVNTVTKSGTNTFKGSAYLYKRSAGLVGLKAMTAEVLKPKIDYNQRGISIGGPIIKNKLFFFLSGEQERINDPATAFTAAQPGQTSGGSVSQVTSADLTKLRDFLKTNYQYDAGAFDNYQLATKSDKIAAKLDWNIDKNNTLSVKYFYLKSSKNIPPSGSGAQGSRSPSLTTLPFFSSYYTINNNFNIGIAELNTRIGTNYANKLTVGYQALRDYRTSPGGGNFPLVDILNAAGNTQTTFGYEPFTANNVLNTDTYQLSDQFTIFAGKHEINLGASYELNKFKNGFAPNYNGGYRFNSFDDFYNSASNGASTAVRYDFRYSALPSGAFPFAYIKAYTVGIFAQDKWQVNDNFKLTYGVRADVPVYDTKGEDNTAASALTGFRGGYQVNTSQYPKTRIQVSPRVGFNWDVNGNGNTQVRGGAGIFTGPVPYVYISNQASNNGVQFGSYSLVPGTGGISPTDQRLVFKPDVNANRPVGAAANTSYNLAITDKDFKFPSNFRGNLAVDQKLPFGFIGTLEGIYSKDINAAYYQNVALPSTGTALVGSDNRIRYSNTTVYPSIGAGGAGNTAANPNITDAILLKNTNKGYTYSITAQLQRTFKEFYFNIAYTRSDARTVNDGGSIAQSTWRDRSVSGDPNADVTSYANFYQPNRIIASASYRKQYLNHLTTSVGLTYEAANTGVASYVYNGDVNGDGQTSNDLVYVPKDANDIVLVKDNAADPRSVSQTYAQLSAYINQDPYLSKRKGKYAERNGLILPYFHLVNFNFTQDLYQTSGKIKNTVQFEFNIINLGNFLNSAWGNFKFVNRTGLLAYKGIDAATGKPTYSFPYFDNANQAPLTNSFGNGVSQASRWQAQIGLRYIFN